MIHELKIFPQYFEEVISGNKTFEDRFRDRDYKAGDYLLLKEWDNGFTGNQVKVKVTYILDNPAYCKGGFVIMGIHIS